MSQRNKMPCISAAKMTYGGCIKTAKGQSRESGVVKAIQVWWIGSVFQVTKAKGRAKK